MPRRNLVLPSVLLLLAACSSSADSGDIAFEHVFDMPTGTSVWTATGEAPDNDLVCPSATGAGETFEDENGAAMALDEVGALFEAGDPYVIVSVEVLTCDDGSGDFTLRLRNEIDPSITDDVPVVAGSWTITGGSGYENVTGEGENEKPREEGTTSVLEGSGTITKE